MKKILTPLFALALLLSACGTATPAAEDETLHVLATTYPVYLFTAAVTEGAEGVEVSLLVNQQTSCLHDYTLTVNDMKAIERADVIVMNGVGLEDFMSDALAQSDAVVIDCSAGVALLPATGHHDHEHDDEHGHYDPHIWMDPMRAVQMAENISRGMGELDEGNQALYQANYINTQDQLTLWDDRFSEAFACHGGTEIITFHDGFQYFADAFDLTLLKAIEEEEGSEASAADIKEVVALIQTHTIPAIFTEKNGSDATARAIARETGVEVCCLDMMMSGEGGGLETYGQVMEENVAAILNGYYGEGTVSFE